ncbi:hypothetical protein F0562_014484 [Nyssa sinensis]|uniref:DNA topoisomerase (ATP-hydrolyzing) n=1 Tax=Nyssa sinensis TaxID=561372 RepID=A0A5J4ZR87_9ASTE|nr:hypothetical protein F0562_014484 [Nyssa sinensis]
MHLFNPEGVIKKYETPEQILEEFFHIRLEFYEKRKRILLDNLEKELLRLENKVRFIIGVVKGEIIVSNRKRADLFLELRDKGFAPFPKKTKTVEAVVVAGATDDAAEDMEENLEMDSTKGVRASDYEYLLSMAIGTLTLEKVQELCADRDKLNKEVDDLRKATPKSMWMKDLDSLDRELDEQEKSDAQAEVARKVMKSRVMSEAGLKVSKQAAKNPRKNNKKTSNAESVLETSASSAMETDNIPEVMKPKARAGSKKAPARKQEKPSLVLKDEDDEDDDEVLELKDRLAAYNLESSPDRSEVMETEVPQNQARKKEPSKRAAAQKKPLSTLTEISDDEDEDEISDEDFELEVVAVPEEKKKGGRKPTKNDAKAAKPPAAAKKRGKQQSQVIGQRLITEVLKPAENSGISPEKKVRKMRASPFNKKSSSVLGISKEDEAKISTGTEEKAGSSPAESAEEMSEVIAPRARPQRANRGKATYVVSDSESDEATDDSTFSDEDEDED